MKPKSVKKKTGFFRLLVHFNIGLKNGFTLQCLDLRKIDEAEAGINRAKETLNTFRLAAGDWNNFTIFLACSEQS